MNNNNRKSRFEASECKVNKKLLNEDKTKKDNAQNQDTLLQRIDKALQLLHEARHLLEDK